MRYQVLNLLSLSILAAGSLAFAGDDLRLDEMVSLGYCRILQGDRPLVIQSEKRVCIARMRCEDSRIIYNGEVTVLADENDRCPSTPKKFAEKWKKDGGGDVLGNIEAKVSTSNLTGPDEFGRSCEYERSPLINSVLVSVQEGQEKWEDFCTARIKCTKGKKQGAPNFPIVACKGAKQIVNPKTEETRLECPAVYDCLDSRNRIEMSWAKYIGEDDVPHVAAASTGSIQPAHVTKTITKPVTTRPTAKKTTKRSGR